MTAWSISRASAPIGVLLAAIGLAGVAALSAPTLSSTIQLMIMSSLALIWGLYVLQLAGTVRSRLHRRAEADSATLAVDLAAVVVPLAGLLPDISERDQSLFCAIWVLKLLRGSAAFHLMARVLVNEARNLLGVMAIFGIVLFCAALAAHVLERDAQPSTFDSIPKAMWWAVVTLTTTGYGDAIPQSFAGRVLAGLVMMCGIGVFALWAGILATGFSEEIRRHDFMRNWQLVSGVPLFQRLGSAELAEIVRALRPRDVPAGAVICRKGEPGDQMYFILEGRVSVAAATPVELGPGTFFGEIALVTGETRSATVTASTAVALLSLHASDFQIVSGRSPELAETVRQTALERRGAVPKS